MRPQTARAGSIWRGPLAAAVGAFAGAAVLRHLVGSRRLSGLATEIDGLTVLLMLVFAVAIIGIEEQDRTLNESRS